CGVLVRSARRYTANRRHSHDRAVPRATHSSRLRRAFPRLTVRWVEDRTAVLVGRLKEGDLDGALLALEANIGYVEREAAGHEPCVRAAASDHPLGAKTTQAKLADLRDEDEGRCFREQALALCTRVRTQKLEFRATSLPTLTQMVADGAGKFGLERICGL